MKLAVITRFHATTRFTYEAAGTIRARLARSEAEVEGWDVLAAFDTAERGDPDAVAELVDDAESADEVGQQARFQLARIDAAAAMRAPLDAAVTRIAEVVGAQDLDRDKAEQAIRAMAFEDEP